MSSDEIIAKRRQLTAAMRAMYRPPLHIIVDETLAHTLDRAWNEYDATLTEQIRTEVLAVINSFDNRDFSATPDQRDVIDPIRRILNRRKAGMARDAD